MHFNNPVPDTSLTRSNQQCFAASAGLDRKPEQPCRVGAARQMPNPLAEAVRKEPATKLGEWIELAVHHLVVCVSRYTIEYDTHATRAHQRIDEGSIRLEAC